MPSLLISVSVCCYAQMVKRARARALRVKAQRELELQIKIEKVRKAREQGR